MFSTQSVYCTKIQEWYKWVNFWLLYEAIYTWERRAIGWSGPCSWTLMKAWRRRQCHALWILAWGTRRVLGLWMWWPTLVKPWSKGVSLLYFDSLDHVWRGMGPAQFAPHPMFLSCLMYYWKGRPKHWPKINSILLQLHVILQILVISLAHVNNVWMLWSWWSFKGIPIWIFLIIDLVVGPLNGLPQDVGLEGSCMLGEITSSPPPWRGFVLKSWWSSSSSMEPVKGTKSVILNVGCKPYSAGRSNW